MLQCMKDSIFLYVTQHSSSFCYSVLIFMDYASHEYFPTFHIKHLVKVTFDIILHILRQRYLNFNVHVNHPGVYLKYTF